MEHENILEIFKILRKEMPKNACYGLRMLMDNSIELFYHPYGCECEINGDSENHMHFIEKVQKSRFDEE